MNQTQNNYWGILSLFAGAGSLFLFFSPVIGFPVAMGGLICAILSRKEKRFSGVAFAGLILSVLGIAASLIYFYLLMKVYTLIEDPQLGPIVNEYLWNIYQQLKEILTASGQPVS